MSNKLHTPEPWRIDPDCGRFNIIGGPNDNPTDVALMQMTGPNGKPDPMRTANGERILACVNACAGLDNPVAAMEEVRGLLRAILRNPGDTYAVENYADMALDALRVDR